MSSPQLQTALWVSQPVLLAAVAAVMYRRRLYKEFPIFFAYALAQIAIFLVQFPVYKLVQFPAYKLAAYHAYYISFWIAMVLNLIFDFKIIHEIFLDIFRPYHALKDLGTALFKWAALIMVLVSVVLISTSPIWNEPIHSSLLLLQRCMRVVQCGLVLFLLAFCRHLNVSWRRQSFGLAWGYGIFASGELISYALYSGGHISQDLLNLITMGALNASILVWLGYAILNTREHAIPVLIPQRWDSALMDIRAQGEPESLIPMFEHMVDRAFSKTQDRHALP
jgi:hypothetical protein